MRVVAVFLFFMALIAVGLWLKYLMIPIWLGWV